MQILQNFKHNPKINTIFISKVCVMCVVLSPAARGLGTLGNFCSVMHLLEECPVGISISMCPGSGGGSSSLGVYHS